MLTLNENFITNLSNIDKVIIQEGFDCNFLANDFQYRYTLTDESGETIGYALEDEVEYFKATDSRKRGYSLHILNPLGSSCATISRAKRCRDRKISKCCYKKDIVMQVYADENLYWGLIVETKQCVTRRRYQIFDSEDKLLCMIRVPRYTKRRFRIKSMPRKEDIGEIGCGARKANNTSRLNLSHEEFGVCFPLELEVETKMLLLAACFSINCNYFQNRVNSKLFRLDEKLLTKINMVDLIENRSKITESRKTCCCCPRRQNVHKSELFSSRRVSLL